MARVLNGNIIGNVGNLNYYMRNGVNYVRKRRGPNKQAPSGRQLANCQQFEMASRFINPISEFIKVSYAGPCKMSGLSPYSLMLSEILKNSIRGTYPDQEMDMGKILVSKGRLLEAVNPKIKVADGLLQYSWEVLDYGWPSANERAMLLACVPELGAAIFNVAGAKRSVGSDYLTPPESWKGKRIETYIAYKAETGLMVSNSTYLGTVEF